MRITEIYIKHIKSICISFFNDLALCETIGMKEKVTSSMQLVESMQEILNYIKTEPYNIQLLIVYEFQPKYFAVKASCNINIAFLKNATNERREMLLEKFNLVSGNISLQNICHVKDPSESLTKLK